MGESGSRTNIRSQYAMLLRRKLSFRHEESSIGILETLFLALGLLPSNQKSCVSRIPLLDSPSTKYTIFSHAEAMDMFSNDSASPHSLAPSFLTLRILYFLAFHD